MQADLNVILPEIVITIFALIGLSVMRLDKRERAVSRITWLTVALLAAMALWITTTGRGSTSGFDGMVVDDPLARFAGVAILLSGAASIVIAFEYMRGLRMLQLEYPFLVSLSVVAMLLMVSAQDLIVVFLSVELQAATLYGLVGMRTRSLRATEAAYKGVLQGLIGSVILLFGISVLFSFAGSTRFEALAGASEAGSQAGIFLGLTLVTVGLVYKLAAVPFHSWAADTYQGATTPVTGFLLTVPKLAALVLLARLLQHGLAELLDLWQPVIATLAAVSMIVGAAYSLRQKDIKRFLVYGSIAHIGFMLAAVAASSTEGAIALLLYALIYLSVYIGLFAFVMSMESDKRPVTDIRHLNLLARAHPTQALALLILFMTLAGLPPLPGFLAKLLVLQAVIDADLFWLTIAAALAYAIGACGYIRLVYLMYFGEDQEPLETNRSALRWGVLVGSALIMVLAIPGLLGLEDVAKTAAIALVR
ncbi:MAG: NADH-quinone oxidoreductase subunit N [Pseudomonadota bacterium]